MVWRYYLNLLEEVFVKVTDMLQLAVPTKVAVIDSTHLVNLCNLEAAWGHTSRVKFRGLSFMLLLISFVCRFEPWLLLVTGVMDHIFQS